ncbi:MAG: DNA-directed DNA polymerase, partial [Candidatus Sericytochromatia bacterium]|nr:DNA-directed DNA polymerase [Candidatus Sericytochromatia bacterium]
MTYQLIKNKIELEELVEYLANQDIVAVDTETTGLDPYLSKVRLVQFATTEKSFIVDCFDFQDLDPLKKIFASIKPI